MLFPNQPNMCLWRPGRSTQRRSSKKEETNVCQERLSGKQKEKYSRARVEEPSPPTTKTKRAWRGQSCGMCGEVCVCACALNPKQGFTFFFLFFFSSDFSLFVARTKSSGDKITGRWLPKRNTPKQKDNKGKEKRRHRHMKGDASPVLFFRFFLPFLHDPNCKHARVFFCFGFGFVFFFPRCGFLSRSIPAHLFGATMALSPFSRAAFRPSSYPIHSLTDHDAD